VHESANKGERERGGEHEIDGENRKAAVRRRRGEGKRGELGLEEGRGVGLGVWLRVRLRQTGGRPGNPATSVAQLTIEKLATDAACDKLSKWQSEKVTK
jgi:hypothetical protein